MIFHDGRGGWTRGMDAGDGREGGMRGRDARGRMRGRIRARLTNGIASKRSPDFGGAIRDHFSRYTTVVPGSTEWVSQTFPPMVAPSPTVVEPPRMVAPA